MIGNKKIKILYIIPSLNSGGAERFILDLIYNLNPEVFETSLLLFSGQGFFYSEAISRGLGVKVLKKRFKIDILNFYNIYRHIRKIKPDIVHTQLGGDIYGKIAAKLAGVKSIVSTEQNVLVNDNKIIKFFKKKTAEFSDKIIAISSAVKRDIIENYQISSEKINLIFNGISVEKFQQDRKNNFNKNQIVFGSIGRLTSQKNFSLLIEALSKIKNKNFKCLIAGEGELRDKLEKEIERYGLGNKVELLGLKKDIKGFLSDLDFFVLPSKWEGLGVVLLEAGLSRLPVLASATGGILDIIKDKKTGILFKNNNINDLARKLDYFLDFNNRKNLDTLGDNLFDYIINKFDIKKVASQYESVYLNLVK
ncbi:MAG TPA: glycosyltransferase [bacterium]|nr:glycosyltransferase [bacterium]